MPPLNNKFRKKVYFSLHLLENVGLFIIAVATIVAIGIEMKSMFQRQEVSLADLLLLFIYLEILFMVANYLESGKLPIRIPLYIAIVALARYIIIDMKNMDNIRLLSVAGAALIVAITVLVIRYGHTKFPYKQ